jgi:hypothetical protein
VLGFFEDGNVRSDFMKARSFLTSWIAVNFSIKTLHHEVRNKLFGVH